MKKLILGGLAALAIGLIGAPTANADYWYTAGERQYISDLYAAGMQPKPGYTTSYLVDQGYSACNVLGNHSGGYVASQIWSSSNSTPNGVSYSQANTLVFSAIANLCPWRWY